jgi:REP element-mobilizing transposase RayT
MKREPGERSNPNLIAGFHHRDHLPHLKREGASYFVTIRLADTLPYAVLQRFKQERAAIMAHALAAKRPLTWNEREDLFRWYSHRVDPYLDQGTGDCFLRRPEIAKMVVAALTFHEGVRFTLAAWVVMPNHVHVVLRPLSDWTLSKILQSWKGYSARQINLELGRMGRRFWQAEAYDHLIRDDEDHRRCCHYTLTNPVSARLCQRPEDWPWSSAYAKHM